MSPNDPGEGAKGLVRGRTQGFLRLFCFGTVKSITYAEPVDDLVAIGAECRWRVATSRVFYSRWSPTTHELLLAPSGQGTIMAAPYTVVGESFHADTPQLWSPTNIRADSVISGGYDLHPDGKRVATAAAQEQAGRNQDKVVFVFNFFDYLRKIAPGTK